MKIINKKIFIIFFIIGLFIFNVLILSIYSTKPDEWYNNLKKPFLNPPNIIFPIVWTILYILIGISYYYGLYNLNYIYWIIPIIHLLLNFSFSPILFYYKQILGSAIIAFLILIFALITLYLFSFKSIISVILLFPYILWLLFANYLAWSLYFLNNK